MHYSSDVQKTVMPIKLIWLALSASLIVYVFVIYTTHGFSTVDNREVGNLKSILMPLSYVPFIFTFLFYKKKDALIRNNNNMTNVPYARGFNEEDQKVLSYYGSYFVIHIIFWAINEAGAILGFVLAFTSGNILYYAYPAAIALFLNLVVMKPNYFVFIQGKRFE